MFKKYVLLSYQTVYDLHGSRKLKGIFTHFYALFHILTFLSFAHRKDKFTHGLRDTGYWWALLLN